MSHLCSNETGIGLLHREAGEAFKGRVDIFVLGKRIFVETVKKQKNWALLLSRQTATASHDPLS